MESAFRQGLTALGVAPIVVPSRWKAHSQKTTAAGEPPVEETEMLKHSLKLVAATCALAATACGSSGGGTSATKDADPATVTGTLRVLVPSYPASNEGKAALGKVVDKLHATYPKVKVEPDF